MSNHLKLPDDLPEPLRSRYIAVDGKCTAKLQEIVELLGMPADEVENLIENWKDADIDGLSGQPGGARLRALIAEHRELSEELFDLLDSHFLP